MSSVTIEHVNIADLPERWRAKLPSLQTERVTVRIDAEEPEAAAVTPATSVIAGDATFASSDPAFGIWREREDLADVEAYLSKLRAPRYNRDGSRNQG